MCQYIRLGVLLTSMVLAFPLYSQETQMKSSSLATQASAANAAQPWMKDSSAKLEHQLLEKYGTQQHERIARGLRQVTEFWRTEDGDTAVFEEFVLANFAGEQDKLDILFGRFQSLLEQLDGHMHEIYLAFRQQSNLDLGPVLPFDEVFGGYDPSAHVSDDFFKNKLAFTILLNFPLTTLNQRLKGQYLDSQAVG